MNWDDQRAVERFLQDQQALNDMVQNVAENYDQILESLQQNEAVSQEILEKMQRIQEIMESIATEDMQRAMEQLAQSMERMQPEDIRRAMENFQFNMQDFAEKLEQTLRLLEEIKNEQNLDRALQIAKEMYNMQDDLMNRTETADDLQALSEQQQRIEEKLKALEEQMQKTLDDMQNSQNQMAQQMQDMLQDMQEGQLSESLQEASEAMQENNRSEAMQQQRQSLSQMSRMISKMEQMKSDMSGSGMQEMIEAIQMTIYRMLMIAKEHQDKVSRIGNDPVPHMPAFVNDFESIQLAMNMLYQAPQVLLILGQKFFNDLNMTINAYRSLFDDVQNSRFNTHRTHTANIQAGINLIIFNLMQSLDNMQQGGGSGSGGMQSLMQSLEQMTGQQMTMNMMTQSMLEQMAAGGNRISNQMRQQMQEIAAEEQRLADNLQRLLHTNPEAQRHSNALNEISNEMREVANRLRQNRVDRNLIEQQNRIMSRMLEVQRSINSRDRSQQRRGETAEERLWELPSDFELNFGNLAERRLLEDEIQRLPMQYRQIILEYLREINKE
jgi:methyl-accepting chemotaxis protein